MILEVVLKQVFLHPLPFLCLVIATLTPAALAQQKPLTNNLSPFCSDTNALDRIDRQIEFTRTFDDTVQRIAVLIRSGDLLWPYERENAHRTFAEALDLAVQNFKEKGDKPRRDGHLSVKVADQRYVVIRAIARRDSTWARKIVEALLKEEAREAGANDTNASQNDQAGEKLLGIALSLLSQDQNAALNFARTSLRYPATVWLPIFLYSLSDASKAAADGFYEEALRVYAGSPAQSFLYLSSYPFGNDHEVSETFPHMKYGVPKNFTPNVSLQRLFIETLLRRVQQATESLDDSSNQSRVSDTNKIWLALTRLEAQVKISAPDLIDSVKQAEGSVFSILNQKDQESVTSATSDHPQSSFEERIEEANRRVGPARNEALATAILSAGDSERVERLIEAASKIDEAELRDKLLDWLYFGAAQRAIFEKRTGDAKRLAAKVAEFDERAYLYLKIAEEAIKNMKNDVEARELLEEVLSTSGKAPDNELKARALLGVAYLYTKVDSNRAISVLGDAVKSINRIESPDFSRDFVGYRIEGKTFGSYVILQTPSFNPDSGFREIGKYDFDGAFYLASNLTNKTLRAMTTLSLVELCLQQTKGPERQKKKSRKAGS